MGRRIIFLDIDGVLRPMMPYSKIRTKEKSLKTVLSERYHDPAYASIDEPILHNVYYSFHGEACYCVRMLCQIPDTEIVISSSWRIGYSIETLKKLFALHKLGDYVRDKTPLLYNNRAAEITKYLQEHDDIDAYLIIDDIDLTRDFPNHCIVTKDHLKLAEYRMGYEILTSKKT